MTCPDTSTAESRQDPNILTYNEPAVAEYYASLNYLTPCEQRLFEAYIRPGMAILDLGVGGGRTTPYLAAKASKYVGVDYASEMIAACRKKFPKLEFKVGDAADLSRMNPSSFDAVVMAFNGMDYFVSDESRFRALREIHRVLKAQGTLIFSSHNPRAIWVRPSWNGERVRRLAESLTGDHSIFFSPVFYLLTLMRAALAGVQAVIRSMGRAGRRLVTRAFWRGEGYWTDPAHGGLRTHGATPSLVREEFSRFGFDFLRVLGDDYPLTSRVYVTDWYYYVFSKTGKSGEQ